MAKREDAKDTLNFEKLASYIKELRNAQDWSTADLCEKSGLSLGFINQLENNKMKSPPKGSSLTALAKAFKISPLKLQQLAGLIPNNHPIEENNEEWQVHFKSKLSDMGLKRKYVDEIINYIETVEIKQNRDKTKQIKEEKKGEE